MREHDVQKSCAALSALTREDRSGAEHSKAHVRYDPQAQAVAARTEWFRQARLQSAVFAMQLLVRGGAPTGEDLVADAERIFEFLTKEDVH